MTLVKRQLSWTDECDKLNRYDVTQCVRAIIIIIIIIIKRRLISRRNMPGDITRARYTN